MAPWNCVGCTCDGECSAFTGDEHEYPLERRFLGGDELTPLDWERFLETEYGGGREGDIECTRLADNDRFLRVCHIGSVGAV